VTITLAGRSHLVVTECDECDESARQPTSCSRSRAPTPFSRKATLALSFTRDLEVGLTT